MVAQRDPRPSSAAAVGDNLQPLLDIREVARLLAVGERHVRRLVFERRIPFVKWGRLIRFDAGELAIWLDSQRSPPSGRGA